MFQILISFTFNYEWSTFSGYREYLVFIGESALFNAFAFVRAKALKCEDSEAFLNIFLNTQMFSQFIEDDNADSRYHVSHLNCACKCQTWLNLTTINFRMSSTMVRHYPNLIRWCLQVTPIMSIRSLSLYRQYRSPGRLRSTIFNGLSQDSDALPETNAALRHIGILNCRSTESQSDRVKLISTWFWKV